MRAADEHGAGVCRTRVAAGRLVRDGLSAALCFRSSEFLVPCGRAPLVREEPWDFNTGTGNHSAGHRCQLGRLRRRVRERGAFKQEDFNTKDRNTYREDLPAESCAGARRLPWPLLGVLPHREPPGGRKRRVLHSDLVI